MADRIEPLRSWETGSDRDLQVSGRVSRTFYRAAIRWMVAEAALARWRVRGGVGLLARVRASVNAWLGRLGMRWARGPV